MSAITNRYTRLVGIEHPIVQEGLGPFRTAKLAAAVSEAGGLGVVADGAVCCWDWLRVSARAVGARISAAARCSRVKAGCRITASSRCRRCSTR